MKRERENEMLSSKLEHELYAWADKHRDQIVRLWVFGSRVSGKRHKDGKPPSSESDIDIAIEPSKEGFHHEQSMAHIWIKRCHDDGWRRELEEICAPWPLSLDLYEQNSVEVYVQNSGKLLFSNQLKQE